MAERAVKPVPAPGVAKAQRGDTEPGRELRPGSRDKEGGSRTDKGNAKEEGGQRPRRRRNVRHRGTGGGGWTEGETDPREGHLGPQALLFLDWKAGGPLGED